MRTARRSVFVRFNNIEMFAVAPVGFAWFCLA